ncbi:hybrid sensor histidine kinase/response regulator, partial [Pseudoxanthomonas sp. SGD-10]
MKACFFFCILLFRMLLHPTFAQNLNNIPEDFKFQHFTSANGLSQRSVMAIVQDRKGYLWFGTRDGLNKFDGNKFIVYRHDLNDTNSLSNNNIHSIYEDSYGNLWIGTQIGLNKYNPKTDQFIRYKHSEKQSNIADHIVRGIVQINRELIWAATDNGIIEINIHTNAIKRIQKQHTN